MYIYYRQLGNVKIGDKYMLAKNNLLDLFFNKMRIILFK